MSISNSLSNALTGLQSTTRQIAIASNNIANALTPGYARQEVALGSRAIADQGNGVGIVGVNRSFSPDLTSARRQADADVAGQSIETDALTTLARSLGQAGDEDGLFDRIGNLETALRSLADTPEQESRQFDAAMAARDVALKLNEVSTEASRTREIADREIGRAVTELNTTLNDIAKLNRKIMALTAEGRDVPDLINQREILIDEVAVQIPVREQRLDNGAVRLNTAEGLNLVDVTAGELVFTSTPIVTSAQVYDPSGGPGLSGLTLRGVDITPGGPGPLQISNGAIAGQFAVRDQIGTDVIAQIDAFAAHLIGRFESTAVDPTLAAGDPGLFTDNGAALDPLNTTGLAGRISLNLAVDPVDGGDPALMRDGLNAVTPGPISSASLPRALLEALTGPVDTSTIPGLSGLRSAGQAVSGLVEHLGILRVNAETTESGLAATRETLAVSEADEIGVDTDAELQSLIQIEQAYAANVQVIQTAERMLDELLRIR